MNQVPLPECRKEQAPPPQSLRRKLGKQRIRWKKEQGWDR